MKRYPLQNLVDTLGLPEAEVARRAGMDRTQLRRAREQGLVERSADRVAVRVGLVPWLVWPDWMDDLEVECAERSCDTRFVPSRKSHRFCSRRCGVREASRKWMRQRYQQDARYREEQRQRSRSYYRENTRAVRIQSAKRRDETREEKRARDRAYYERNRDLIVAKKRAYYAANREELAARQRERDRAKRQVAA